MISMGKTAAGGNGILAAALGSAVANLATTRVVTKIMTRTTRTARTNRMRTNRTARKIGPRRKILAARRTRATRRTRVARK